MNLAEHPRCYAVGPISVGLTGWYWSIRFGRRLAIVVYPHGNQQIAPKPRRKARGEQVASDSREGRRGLSRPSRGHRRGPRSKKPATGAAG